MPITTTDTEWRLTGGAANADPLLSLGGAMSSVAVTGSTIFDAVSGTESAAGDTEYRGVCIRNGHATLTWLSVVVYINPDTPAADTDADIALALEAVNVTMATIATEDTAPAGVTFTNAAVSFATGLAVGDIPATQFKGVWLKRVITAAAAASNDSFTANAAGDTNP